MTSYIKLALKVLGRRKVFTFISLFGITMTLIVLVVATAVLDDAFEPHEPQSRFDRVLGISRVSMTGPHDSQSMNPGFALVRDYIYNLPGIEAASAYSEPISIAIYRNGRNDAQLKRTDAAYWRILDFHFLEGRPFSADEEQRGALVAVITGELRQRLFEHGSALDKTIEIDGRNFRIIGVVPAAPITRFAAWADVWVPHTTARSSDYQHQLLGNYNGLVLARTRSDFPRLKDEFAARVKRMPVTDPKVYKTIIAGLDTPFEAFARNAVPSKFGSQTVLLFRMILMAVALLFMSLPALNLITLNLSRILERASEIGVRKAFGASRGALVRQFVFENVVLTLIGGAVSIAGAAAAIALLNHSGVIPAAQFEVNVRVFLYGILLAAFFGIFSGVYPAWRMSRLHAVNALRGGAQ
jgi:putative ABC transport system permease protein